MTPPSYVDFTAVARVYAMLRTRRLEAIRPATAQAATLKRLLHRAVDTDFGRAHRFATINSIESYQSQVPIRDYADFWTDWWEPAYPGLVNISWPGKIPYFSLTSGTTTGRSKYIPYTIDMRRSAVRGFLDLLCFHLKCRPQSRLMGGAVLALTGPVGLDSATDGATEAAVSTITADALPGWLRHRVLPPPELADLDDWQEKIHRLAPLSLTGDVRFLGGSPNWLLIFLAEVAELHPGSLDRLTDWYPGLELIVHGGVNFAPYRDRFRALLADSHAETREMYSASEGVFAYADRGDGQGMRLHMDGRIFYEFVPPDQLTAPNPDRRWIGTAETGVDYALVISSAAGLWSYVVGDIVRLVDLDPPRLIVNGRVQKGLSTFGEHLIEAEIAEALAGAATAQGIAVLDYSVGSQRGETSGYHLFLIEPAAQAITSDSDRLASAIDARLCALNEDYAELRRDQALAAPQVRLVPPGGFATWMKIRRKQGGQNKVPRIVTDPDLFADIARTVLNVKGRASDT